MGYSQSQFVDNDSNYIEKTLILKLDPQFRHLQLNDGINSADLNYYLNKISFTFFGKIYPNHEPLLEKINSIGDSLIDLSLYYKLKYSADFSEKILISKLTSIGIFDYIEQEPKNQLFYMPNDPLLALQYFPEKVHAFEAWDLETGDSNIVIGIVDTGTDLLGEDLKDGIKVNIADPIDGLDNDNDGFTDNHYGWDLANWDNNPTSYGSHHGCFTTGISSATVNNGIGIAGLGYNTKYLPVKISNDDGALSKEYEGIIYAADHGANIINNSWGGHVKSRFGQDMVNYATFNKNALVIGAGGNSDNDWWIYPASFENVISVAATDSLDQRWIYSSFGSQIDLAAPGEAVYSTWTTNGYFASSGTSFAAPGVAGAAAILKSYRPNLSALQLGEQLRVSADLIDTITANQPFAGQLGAGRLNMYRALVDSLSPAIRYRDRTVVSNHFSPSDTIKLKGKFTNFLASSSQALMVSISSNSPYLSIVNPLFSIGSLSTLGEINNLNAPFLLKIAPSTPPNTIAEIKFAYSDTNYSGFECFRFTLNPDFINFEDNNLKTTIANNSQIGYTNYNMSNGIGMYYKNSLNLLSWAGLVVGNSSGKVSSNIYGENGYDADFVNTQSISSSIDPLTGTKIYETEYNDNGANFTKLSISVKQQFYTLQNEEDIVFLKYQITNNGSTTLNTLYIGLFADYDIDISYKNRAETDTILKMAYTYSTTGGEYAGIMLLDSLPMIANQINNDGSENSINIYDGFLDYEKYNALTTRHDSAGFGNAIGKDVSTMISTGPNVLLPGQTKEVNFALLGGDHLFGLKQAALKAHNIFYNVTGLNEFKKIHSAEIFPNPFTETLEIKFANTNTETVKFELYSMDGKLVRAILIKPNTTQSRISVSQLASGQYFYKLIFEDNTETGILIKP